MPNARLLLSADELGALTREAIAGAREGALFELPSKTMVRLLAHVAVLENALAVEAGGFCRVCGCTEHTPCGDRASFCGWVDDTQTLCTACSAVDEGADVEDGDGDPEDGPLDAALRELGDDFVKLFAGRVEDGDGDEARARG